MMNGTRRKNDDGWRHHHFLMGQYGKINMILTVLFLVMSIANPMILLAAAVFPIAWVVRNIIMIIIKYRSSNPWPLSGNETVYNTIDPFYKYDGDPDDIRTANSILASKSELDQHLKIPEKIPLNWEGTGESEVRFLPDHEQANKTLLRPESLDRIVTLGDKGMNAVKRITDLKDKIADHSDGYNDGVSKNIVGIPGGSVSEGVSKFGRKNANKGRDGEIRTASILNTIAEEHPDEIYVMHDLSMPKDPKNPTRSNDANIDHIIIIGDKVIPIDSKNYKMCGYTSIANVADDDWINFHRQQSLDWRLRDIHINNETMRMIYDRVSKCVMHEVVENQPHGVTLFKKQSIPVFSSPWVVLDWSGRLDSQSDLGLMEWPNAYPITEGELIANIEYLCDGTPYDKNAVKALSPYLESRI